MGLEDVSFPIETSGDIPTLDIQDHRVTFHICYYQGSVRLFGQHFKGGGEVAQSLASLSTKRATRFRARLDPLVIERWNSITVLLT